MSWKNALLYFWLHQRQHPGLHSWLHQRLQPLGNSSRLLASPILLPGLFIGWLPKQTPGLAPDYLLGYWDNRKVAWGKPMG